MGTLSGREQIGDRPRRVARLRPVVREQPSEVGPVREPVLEVARDRAVEFPPGGARHRPVRAVADQYVLEAVLDVVGDVALGVPDDQPAVLERIQRIDHPVRRHHGGEHVAPEGVPDHRGVEQHRPRTRRERVDPRSDRREHRRGQFLWPSLVGDRGRELLEEQRVPFAGGHDAVDRRRGHLREQCRRHGHGLARRERLERQGGLADHAAPPRATGLEELESREREEHHPRVSHVRDEVVDQIEERRVGPVHVLEDDEDRVSLGEVLDEHPRGELEVHDLVGRFVEPEAEDHAEVPRGFLRFGFGVEGGDGGRKLGAGDLDAVVLVDVGDLSDDLACGSVRRAFFVRQAPAPQRDAAGRLDVSRQLASEARLADPGRAEDRHEVRPRRIDRPAPDAGEDLELVVATDERSAGHRARTGGVERCQHLPRGDRLALALRLDRLELLELERVTDQLVGLLPDQHAAGGRCVLQACRGVGDVAGRERLARRRVDRDDGLAGAHRSPELEIEPGMRDVQLVDALDDRRAPLGRPARRRRPSRAASPNTAMTASPMYFSTAPP